MKKPFNGLSTALLTGAILTSALSPVLAEEDTAVPIYEGDEEIQSTMYFQDAYGTIYQEAVDFLKVKGIAQGITDNYFGVNEPIKRVDVAMILGTFTQINVLYPNAPKAGFRDLPSRATKTVSTLKYRGIVNGKTAASFGAGDNITRGEAALMLYNAFADDFYPTERTTLPFTDVSSRYEEAISILHGAGIVKGSAGKFGTNDAITRGQLALMIHRIAQYHSALQKKEKAGFVAFGDSNTEAKYYEKQFPEHLNKQWADQVAAVYSKNLTEANYNAGVTGDETSEGLARFKKEVLDVKPEYTTIMFGINDALLYKGQPQVSKEKFRNNLVHMIHQLRLRGIKPVLMTNTPIIESIYYNLQKSDIKPAYADKGGLKNWINEYNEIIRQVSKEQQVTLVDVNKMLTEKAGGSTDAIVLKSGLVETVTGIHMTPEAADIVAEAVKQALPNALD